MHMFKGLPLGVNSKVFYLPLLYISPLNHIAFIISTYSQRQPIVDSCSWSLLQHV